MKKRKKEITVAGKKITFETGFLAGKANASVLARSGDTVVLATIVASEPREGIDYFPLSVEYIERLYAGGIIKGSRWVKREGKPTEDAVLTARMIDRCIRPLFPKYFKDDTQLVLTKLSVDQENDPDVLAGLAGMVALYISNIPWEGPLGIVRVGLRDGNSFINPSLSEIEDSELDLIVASSEQGVVMLEGGAEEVSEDDFLEAIKLADQENQKIIGAMKDLREEWGKKKSIYSTPNKTDIKKIKKMAVSRVDQLVDQLYEEKIDLFDHLNVLTNEVKDELEGIKTKLIVDTIKSMFKKAIRKEMLKGKRVGGRKLDEVRDLTIKTDLLPRTHGTGLFQRGETQVLTVATLADLSLKQLIETAEGEESKRYIHHYSMPPYSLGETGRYGSPKRREIGHGALAGKALLPVLPSEEDFPYTIRLVSEVLSSDGSTSMASTCGSTLALMDAGVPITAPVAGIAIGLVTGKDKRVLLTDMKGIEDFNGDMDFKVTGTKKGITAIQVDIKVKGLSMDLVKEALARARQARLQILEQMQKVISKPKKHVSQYAPKIEVIDIPVKSIGTLIGPGGKTIKGLIEETGCTIDVGDSGQVTITGIDRGLLGTAVEKIKAMTREVEPGETFDGEVTRVEPFGAFVQFLPGKKGLVHVSKMGKAFIKSAEDVLKVGQEVKVKLEEVDQRGRYNLILVSPRFDDGLTSRGGQPKGPQVSFD